ncbi:uncharacterized protein EI90DRAFT_2875785, partial [Cantharellus anzutake]|uniref:uncharacterized protein n=1 Tax=Cantharellus anzutake TaxID=1750568 RepID=UPI001905C9A8
SLYKLNRRITMLSGVQSVSYDCCINSCCAFIGDDLSNADVCPFCQEPRFDAHKCTRNIFDYIPLTPRFQSMFSNPSLVKKMSYRSTFRFDESIFEDVFSGSHYQTLTSENVIIDGIKYAHTFFSNPEDVALGILTDGFQVF